MTVSELRKFVAQHDGCEAVEVVDGGRTLIVESDVIVSGHDTFDARVERMQDRIPATLQAVRDWLGY